MLSHTYLVTLIIHHIIFHVFGIFILHSHDVAVDYLLLLRVYCRCQVVLTICVEWSLLNVEALDFDCLISYCVSWTFRPFFLSSLCIVLPTIVKEAGWSTKSSPSDRSQICRFDF